jgi:hypothetical protein
MKCPRFSIAKAGGIAVLAVTMGLAIQSTAQIYTLTDLNSVASINLNPNDPLRPVGMYDWSVGGQNQLAQQWFWYRVGNAAERSIDWISTPAVSLIDNRSISIAYNTTTFGVEINYLLTGGAVGSRVSDILETIRIRNFGTTPLDMHFFQYSDFNLQGSPNNDVVRLGTNLRGLFNEASQHDAGLPAGQGLTETVTTPGANHGELGIGNYTLSRLNDDLPTVLNDGMGAVGPADVTWALQWDLTINPGSSVVISKDKNVYVTVIPEPSTFALLSLGLAAIAFRRRSP